MNPGSDKAGSQGAGLAVLFVLLSGGALAGMVQLAILPSLTQMAGYFSDRGWDGAFIAQLVTTTAAPTMAFGAPLIGWLAGLIGKRQVLLASALLYAVAGVAGSFTPDLWSLLASRFILGLASAGLGTMAVTYIAELYDSERRDKLIGWYTVIGGAGSFLTLLAAGKLVGMAGWRAPFALYGVGLVVFLVALFSLRDRARPQVAVESSDDASLRGTWGIFALITIISVVMYMVTIQGAFMLDGVGIKSPELQSEIISASTPGSMLGAYLFGFLRPRLGFLPIIALSWGALGISVVGFASTSDTIALTILAGLTGFGSGLMTPATQSAVLNIVSPAASSRAVGLAIGCIFLGQFLNPILVKPLASGIGIQSTFIWIGVASLGAAVLTLLWRAFNGVRAATAPGS